MHAAKYALWAVKKGGRVVVRDSGRERQGIEPFRVTTPVVRQLVLRALASDCERPTVSDDGSELTFHRTSDPPDAGWSAGVVFSGQDAEIPQLTRCLEGLLAQPELAGRAGEVVVCGPTRSTDFLPEHPAIRYLPYDIPDTKPFPISAKKNFLVDALAGPRILVLHARVELDPDVLRHAPREFDLLSPNVFVAQGDRRLPNTCYVAIDPSVPHLVPRRFTRTTRNVPARRYLDLLRRGRPYIDGGAFMTTRRAYDACPLLDSLSWGDCEDIEWCQRAEAVGLLIDLATDVTAVSATSKHTRTGWILPRPMHAAVQTASAWSRAVRNIVSG